MNLAADIVLFLSMDHLSPPSECQPRILRKDALSTWYSRVLVPFKCLAQTSSEKGALAVDGNKYRDHNWTMCRERDAGAHSSKWDDSINSLPSELRELCRRGSRKILRVKREQKTPRKWDLSTQQAWYTYELMEIVRVCIEPDTHMNSWRLWWQDA